jgi:hypothetical protein
MLWGVTYPKFSSRSCRNNLLKFKHGRAKKWDNCSINQDLKMPLGELLRNDMRSMHANVYEFSMHRKGDINLSLFRFSKICTKEYYESRIFEYMTMMC